MASTEILTPAEKHRRAQLYALLTYGTIIVTFVGVCAIAVIAMMNMEAHKETFHAITVTKPISGFDTTYMNKKQAHK